MLSNIGKIKLYDNDNIINYFKFWNHFDNFQDSKNLTLISKIKLIQRQWRKYKIRKLAAKIIQNKFRECISNPYHPICKRRLQREFIEMYEET